MFSHKRRGISIAVGLGAAAVLSLGHGPVEPTVATPAGSPTHTRDSAPLQTPAQVRADVLQVASRARVASPRIPSRDLPTSASDATDLPDTALNAYQGAAAVLTSVRPRCHLDWTLLAAVGQIESDHGRSGGATLLPDGTSSPAIRGVVRRGAARLRDTDRGRLDGDRAADRAFGPMQFLPSTWLTAQVDGDGDGIRSGDDIDDAALAAAVYLCAWGDDLGTARGMKAAVLRYNPSPDYVSTAVELASRYRTGSYGFVATYLPQPGAGTATAAAPTIGHPSTAPEPVPAKEHPAAQPTRQPTPTPTPTPTRGPEPSEDPAPSTTPTPSPTAPASSPTSSPTPAGTHLDVRTATGTLVACPATGFCLDDQPLALGPLDSSSLDYDADGTVESRGDELAGLVGSGVGLRVDDAPGPLVVRSVNGTTWSPGW